MLSVNEKESIWALKYRPEKLEELILPPRVKDQLEAALDGKSSHFIFYGNAGVGKTSAAKAIVNELGASSLFINASLETGIDVVRDKLTNYCSSMSAFGSSGRKVVILDEIENFSPLAFQSLRGFLEQFAKQALFIMTTNYINRIPDPIMSRLNAIEFNVLPDERPLVVKQMYERAISVLDNEGIEFDKSVVAKVVASKYPDMRGVITSLQKGSLKGKLQSIVLQGGSAKYSEIVEMVKDKNWSGCRSWVADNVNQFSYGEFYDELSRQIDVGPELAEVSILTSNYDYRSQFVVSKEITVIAFLTEVMGSL